MGRNQIDLFLLISILLVGSFYYTKNLNKHIANIKSHCKEAQKVNHLALEGSKYKLIRLAKQFPKYHDQVLTGLENLDLLLAESTFASSINDKTKKLHKALTNITPFAELKYFKVNHIEGLYAEAIKVGEKYYLKNHVEKNSELAILVESITEKEDKLELKLSPFTKFSFSENEVYALTSKDTSLIAPPNYLFCGNLQKTKFAFKTEEGKFLPVSLSNQFNSRT